MASQMEQLVNLVEGWYDPLMIFMVVLALLVFILLFVISAPYGRHARRGFGPLIPVRAGWLVMEAPASLLMLSVFFFVDTNITVYVFLVIWQIHYFHRAFIYPFTLKSAARMPVLVVLMAIVFNTVNAWLNGYHFVLHGDWYDQNWLLRVTTIMGMLLFVTGYWITKKSDKILRDLRGDGTTGYKVPRGFLYEFVSCPNYFGEVVQWIGWAMMTLSPAGWVFVIWTLANLLPRAVTHHKWYIREFTDYPGKRKAMIPFVL